ncbi:MAG: hypothetical protein E7346_04410 [Clostridiales bacterium]|nr:hypothetical protein [Clostridiales bacterium]
MNKNKQENDLTLGTVVTLKILSIIAIVASIINFIVNIDNVTLLQIVLSLTLSAILFAFAHIVDLLYKIYNKLNSKQSND